LKIRKINEEQLLRRVSELALTIDTGDSDYNAGIKIKLLSSLRGIHTATASAILTLIYPQDYAIIDRRNWRLLFGTSKTLFTPKDYVKYLNEVKLISKEFNLKPQTIDLALWQKDKLTH
jgi:thermostable 8-oxoguanine DNA glycosylase